MTKTNSSPQVRARVPSINAIIDKRAMPGVASVRYLDSWPLSYFNFLDLQVC